MKQLKPVKLPEHLYPHNIQQLFFRTYSCEVPAIALKSIAEIRERGVYAIGNDETEIQARHMEDVPTSLSVNKMFTIWQRSYKVSITNPKDCVDIFNTITSHLQHWLSYLSHGIQIADAPFQDLIELDRFADSIYEHSRFERKKRGIDYFESALTNGLGFSLNPSNALGTNFVLNPLGSGGGTMYFNPNNYQNEEREKFGEQFERLGGRMSHAVRQHERDSIFGQIAPNLAI